MPKFGAKNSLFGYFSARILKIYCIWYRDPQICQVGKFCEKKYCKFGIKNALFWFSKGIFFKNYCYLLNWHPRFCEIVKISRKNKIAKFSIKKAFLGIFGLEFQKTIVLLETSPLKLSNWKLLWENENVLIWDQKQLIWIYFG